MSLGEGLAYNYYAGYLNLVLHSVADRISSSEYGKSTTNKKLFVLIPANGEMPGKLQDADKSIRQVGTLDPLMIDRAGFKRKYPNNVYGLVRNEKEVTFVADMPANLLTLRDMTEDFELTGFTEQSSVCADEARLYPHLSGIVYLLTFEMPPPFRLLKSV
ncbi:PREDICTED: stimulator of interferon genes protein-like [Priapulus caudatus]|uniref:Stimulator of interferon genes protein-like n=1 Tax=Priapulus caudatus TaxID=37621 RepID=A0ABM1EC35_PRICU|nr:PREDICTED: stimulator of interferon genes protein-like [Priapulus caudatus]